MSSEDILEELYNAIMDSHHICNSCTAVVREYDRTVGYIKDKYPPYTIEETLQVARNLSLGCPVLEKFFKNREKE
jgi:hypothetical protein